MTFSLSSLSCLPEGPTGKPLQLESTVAGQSHRSVLTTQLIVTNTLNKPKVVFSFFLSAHLRYLPLYYRQNMTKKIYIKKYFLLTNTRPRSCTCPRNNKLEKCVPLGLSLSAFLCDGPDRDQRSKITRIMVHQRNVRATDLGSLILIEIIPKERTLCFSH